MYDYVQGLDDEFAKERLGPSSEQGGGAVHDPAFSCLFVSD
jgi:hypothetical protein